MFQEENKSADSLNNSADQPSDQTNNQANNKVCRWKN